MLVGILALAIGIVILNGFAAGVVASIYFWGGRSTVSKRAAWGALAAGVASVLLIAWPIYETIRLDGESVGMGAAILLLFLAIATVVALPGAIILSRKIGDSVTIDPDTFR